MVLKKSRITLPLIILHASLLALAGYDGQVGLERHVIRFSFVPHAARPSGLLATLGQVKHPTERTTHVTARFDLRRGAGQSLPKNPNRPTHAWESKWAPNYRRFRKPLFRNIFRLVPTWLAFSTDKTCRGPCRSEFISAGRPRPRSHRPSSRGLGSAARPQDSRSSPSPRSRP